MKKIRNLSVIVLSFTLIFLLSAASAVLTSAADQAVFSVSSSRSGSSVTVYVRLDSGSFNALDLSISA